MTANVRTWAASPSSEGAGPDRIREPGPLALWCLAGRGIAMQSCDHAVGRFVMTSLVSKRSSLNVTKVSICFSNKRARSVDVVRW
jgi:hypothetical protein